MKGSVAIFSNSGGFTTTIAQYLGTAGWGTTTLVSSGKDLYIHYACPDFAHAFAADDRSAAAVLYSEPGGYYEHGIEWTKPVVACVVGRWKSKLTRAVGHAGAMAGSGDRAEDKENWFMEAFGVSSIFTPDNPVVSKKGAVVTNIADIPGGADRGDGAERRRAGLRAARQPRAEAVARQRPGPAAAGRDRLAYGDGARALCGADRDARPAGRGGRGAADDEGQVGRLGHGPEDAGDERARARGARPGAAAARGLLRAAAGARDRRRERPGDARRGGGGRGEPRRRPDPGRGRRGARRRQRAERGDGGRGRDRRAVAGSSGRSPARGR